jgi:hypothetical protein
LFSAWGSPPVPFQVATVASGVSGYSLNGFVTATALSRSIRYFGLGFLVWHYGDKDIPRGRKCLRYEIIESDRNKDIEVKNQCPLDIQRMKNLELTDNILEALRSRYLLRDHDLNIVETPTELFQHVAKHLVQAELIFGNDVDAQRREKFFLR